MQENEEDNFGLRVTEIIGCKRSLWFSYNNYRKSEKSRVFDVGTDIHDAIEMFWSGEEPIVKYKVNVERLNRFLEWNRANTLDIAFFEQRFWHPIGDIYFSGKCDFLTEYGIIYDIKSGMRKTNLDRVSLQLGGYKKLLEYNDIEVTSGRGLFLGEYNMIFRDSYVPCNIDGFEEKLCEALKVISSIIPPPIIEVSTCFLCDYRGVCKNV